MGVKRATFRQILLLPSYLCLDVSLVALGWSLCLARDRVERGGGWPTRWDFTGLFLTVWGIYLCDRILDVSRGTDFDNLSPRHEWALRHRPLLIGLASVVPIGFAFAILPQLGWGTIRAGLFVGVATVLYFLTFRFSSRHLGLPKSFPAKESAIGVIFAGGVAIAATGGESRALPMGTLIGMVLLFTGNCLLIGRAEEKWDRQSDPASYFSETQRFRQLPEISLLLAIGTGMAMCLIGPGFATVSLVVCSVATFGLARSPALRSLPALADGVLLLPWLLLWVFRGR